MLPTIALLSFALTATAVLGVAIARARHRPARRVAAVHPQRQPGESGGWHRPVAAARRGGDGPFQAFQKLGLVHLDAPPRDLRSPEQAAW